MWLKKAENKRALKGPLKKKGSLYKSLFQHLKEKYRFIPTVPRPGDPINYTHTQALEGHDTGGH